MNSSRKKCHVACCNHYFEAGNRSSCKLYLTTDPIRRRAWLGTFRIFGIPQRVAVCQCHFQDSKRLASENNPLVNEGSFGTLLLSNDDEVYERLRSSNGQANIDGDGTGNNNNNSNNNSRVYWMPYSSQLPNQRRVTTYVALPIENRTALEANRPKDKSGGRKTAVVAPTDMPEGPTPQKRKTTITALPLEDEEQSCTGPVTRSRSVSPPKPPVTKEPADQPFDPSGLLHGVEPAPVPVTVTDANIITLSDDEDEDDEDDEESTTFTLPANGVLPPGMEYGFKRLREKTAVDKNGKKRKPSYFTKYALVCSVSWCKHTNEKGKPNTCVVFKTFSKQQTDLWAASLKINDWKYTRMNACKCHFKQSDLLTWTNRMTGLPRIVREKNAVPVIQWFDQFKAIVARNKELEAENKKLQEQYDTLKRHFTKNQWMAFDGKKVEKWTEEEKELGHRIRNVTSISGYKIISKYLPLPSTAVLLNDQKGPFDPATLIDSDDEGADNGNPDPVAAAGPEADPNQGQDHLLELQVTHGFHSSGDMDLIVAAIEAANNMHH